MKKIIYLLSAYISMVFNPLLNAAPVNNYDFSIWTNYQGMQFKGLSQSDKTTKLQRLFEDQVNFAKNYNNRRVLIKILNPAEFDFFKTENFDATREDNFFYWAKKLSQHAEIEVVFDADPFDIGTQSWTDRFINYAADWLKAERPLGNFRNLAEKLSWTSFINDMDVPSGKKQAFIRGITIDPQGIEEENIQLIINILDQYRYNASKEIPANPYPNLRIGAYLNLDQKDIAFSNLGRFPLHTDLRGQKPQDIGVIPPENFPSEGPEYRAPAWRENINHPLLDTVYLQMADKRLIESIYQNTKVIPNFLIPNEEGAVHLAKSLAKNMRGEPIIQGPGHITSQKGSKEVSGRYTFFRTGGGKYAQGQVHQGGVIEVRPPYASTAIQKVVIEEPESNKAVQISSTFSTTEDLKEAPYYITATPVSWSSPKTTGFLLNKIYYVFDTGFKAEKDRYFGNWSLENFLDFLFIFHKNPKKQLGFLSEEIFTHLDGKKLTPQRNIVLYDFTTIPNGKPYPDINWQLGNQSHQ